MPSGFTEESSTTWNTGTLAADIRRRLRAVGLPACSFKNLAEVSARNNGRWSCSQPLLRRWKDIPVSAEIKISLIKDFFEFLQVNANFTSFESRAGFGPKKGA